MDNPDQPPHALTECTVAAWIGSPNLGDELVFSALAAQLRARDLAPVALSVAPEQTTADHGIAARKRRTVLSAGGGTPATVLGGGGLLQDETSTLNLDLHLMPLVAARLRREVVAGVGLGAGRLTTRAGRLRVRAALAGVPLAVRDAGSADLLEEIGLGRPVVAADLSLSLAPPIVDPVDRIVVSLRPWSGRRHRLPARFRRHTVDDRFVVGAARALDDLNTSTGLPIHLVAFDAPKDHPLHLAIAARMRHTPSLTCPDASTVLAEVAASRLVVGMRYHAGMAAVLAGRPAVLIGYSSKVDSLAADVGPAAVGLRHSGSGLGDLAGAASAVIDRGDAMDEARARLQDRERGNGAVLDHMVEELRQRA